MGGLGFESESKKRVQLELPGFRRSLLTPLATLAFEVYAVGDTGLKTAWVRCRHGSGQGGVRWGGEVGD